MAFSRGNEQIVKEALQMMLKMESGGASNFASEIGRKLAIGLREDLE